MISGALLLLGLFFLPMWNITLEAPQYPEPIGMDIYINRFADANPNDIQNINIMNHYVEDAGNSRDYPRIRVIPSIRFWHDHTGRSVWVHRKAVIYTLPGS